MAIVFKVSKPGYEVHEEVDAKNFIFDSTLNHLKTALSGSYQQSINNGAEHTQTIAHGLAYRPLAFVYYRDTADSKWRVSNADPEFSVHRVNTLIRCFVYCDTTNVYIKTRNDKGSTATVEVKYEIFYEGDV